MGVKYKFSANVDNKIHQGDIFKNVPYLENYTEKADRTFELNLLKFPYAIVLTQECDLEHHNNDREKIKSAIDVGASIKHDKFLVSLLCAPLYNAQQLYDGSHLSELEFSHNEKSIRIEAERKNREQRIYIQQNREPRYHYIEFDGDVDIVPSVIDFKHYFSISFLHVENQIHDRICSVDPIFRELISQRYANYLSRIGLPEPSATD